MMKRWFWGLVGIFILTFLFNSTGAYADVASSMKKIKAQNILTCRSALKNEITNETAGQYIKYGDQNNIQKNLFSNTSVTVPLPNSPITAFDGDYKSSPLISCKDFLFGGNNWSGLVDRKKYDKDYAEDGYPSVNSTDAFLKNLGYNRIEEQIEVGKKMCLAVKLTYGGENTDRQKMYWVNGSKVWRESNMVCFNSSVVDDKVMVKVEPEFNSDPQVGGLKFYHHWANDNTEISVDLPVLSGSGEQTYTPLGSGSIELVGPEAKWEDVKSTFDNYMKNYFEKESWDPGYSYELIDLSKGGSPVTVELSRNSRYELADISVMRERLLGDGKISPVMDQAEVYNLYVKYLSDGEYVRMLCDNVSGDNWMSVRVKFEGEIQTCYAMESVVRLYTGANGYDDYDAGRQYYQFNRKKMSLADIIKQINSFNLNSIIDSIDDVVPNGEPDDPVDPENPEPGETEITCANSAAAESLGWILCPLLNVLSNAANDIYNNTVEPMLQIQPELFSQDDNYGTKYAWDVFQNIANIIFVIIFLFVIFSQLTGVGIDNYGIKKILPKLIIAAILVNLSYYICLICVDLSNIIGNGLQSMFDNLPLSADGMATSITIAGESGSQSFSIVPTAITGVALLGVLVTGIWAVIANPAILLSLLVSALGIVIAIFFLFILLSARQAAVIVLTVISPVAFVCYLLPNTKKLFDKYIQLGKGLLLLYPICGLLVGGGNYVSKLLLSSGFARDNGIAAAFTAMIIGVVPIFFIPSLLKSSFAVLGNLGAKISGFGERIRGGATRGIRNMEGYKRVQERGTERGTRIRAGIGRDGKEKELSGFGRFMRGGKRNMARARSQYLKDQDARQREGSLMGVGFEAAQIGQKKKADRDETENYMTLINEKTRNGEDKKALYELFDEYVMGKMPDGSIDKSKINKSGAVAIARIAGRRKDTSADFLSEKLTKNDVANQYDAKTMAAVAKEISTGENSGMYRTSAPLGFEFAAQFNKEFAEDENGNQIAGSAVYSDWRNRENVDRALSNYVTNSQELVGVKGSSLKEIAQALEDGVASEKQKVRLQDLATSAIENRNKPGAVWDSTKAEELCRISGRYNYNAATGEITLRSEFANAGQASNNSGVAEGEVFNVQGGGSGGPGGPTPTSPMTPPADSRSSVPQNIGGNSGADSVSE